MTTDRYEFESDDAVQDGKTILSTKDTENVVRVAVEVEYAENDADEPENDDNSRKDRVIRQVTDPETNNAQVLMALNDIAPTEADAVTFREVAESSGIDPDNVTPVLSRLTDGPLAKRHEGVRPYEYWITAAGKREVKKLQQR